MSALDWLTYLALAFVLGIAGQLVRVAIGLKKMHDKNIAGGQKTSFDPKKFWISIALGALAGLITAILKWDTANAPLQRDFIFTLMAAGYAGSDIIEGLIEQWTKPELEAEKINKINTLNDESLNYKLFK